MGITVHVAIGNSDDKLSQHDWMKYQRNVEDCIQSYAEKVYGVWYSAPDSRYQNMCIGFECGSEAVRERIKSWLAAYAFSFKQDGIAWNESETAMVLADKDAMTPRNYPPSGLPLCVAIVRGRTCAQEECAGIHMIRDGHDFKRGA